MRHCQHGESGYQSLTTPAPTLFRSNNADASGVLREIGGKLHWLHHGFATSYFDCEATSNNKLPGIACMKPELVAQLTAALDTYKDTPSLSLIFNGESLCWAPPPPAAGMRKAPALPLCCRTLTWRRHDIPGCCGHGVEQRRNAQGPRYNRHLVSTKRRTERCMHASHVVNPNIS